MTAGGRGVTGGVGSRREARERALTLLYEAASRKVNPGAALHSLAVTPDQYVVDVVKGVGTHIDALDSEIDRAASGWSIDRMPMIDVCILRMGLWELTHRPDVPATAAITEAVALASQFSTDRSARFVNGVLARLARELRPDEATPDPADIPKPVATPGPPADALPDLATVTDATLAPDSEARDAEHDLSAGGAAGSQTGAVRAPSAVSWSGPLALPAPPLADPLVRLRSWQVDDAPALVSAWGDPAVIDSTAVPPDTSEAYARRWIEGDELRRTAGLSLDLVIVVASGEPPVLGEVGLVPTGVPNTLELGWWVGSAHRGHGYGSHAVSLLARWAQATLGAEVTASIPATNEGSIAVATKAGFVLDTEDASGSTWRLPRL